jgi:hypothetical protein
VPSGTIFKLKVDLGLHCGCDGGPQMATRATLVASLNSKDKHDESHERTRSVQEIWQQERQASAFEEGILMIDLIIIGIGAIAGIILGLRFKILILVPAILLATAAITVTGIVSWQ